MNENEHCNTNNYDEHWDLLWRSFEQIIQSPKEQQTKRIEQIKQQHPQLFPELENLIQSHQTDSSVLDREASDPDFQMAFKPPKSIGGFEILEPLGSGGLGDVYKARKQEDGFSRTVAIKFAPAGKYSPMVLDSFNNELKILLSLNHPHIERLFEGGVSSDNIPYLVVEFIDGEHIDSYCDRKQLNVKQRIKLFLQVCQAVAVMHQSLIIHRDIKASNIMVDQNGVTKLLDFGLAKLTDSKQSEELNESTVSGFMMTLAYASPEQIRGQNITTASDVYSLGMLLYYLLTGRLPYSVEGHDLVAISQQITGKIPPLASQNIKTDAPINASQTALQKKLKGELDAILAKAISKNPQRRYVSAQQLADDLARHLSHEPVLAKPDTVIYRMRKFIQRHPVGVVMTTLVMLSLMLLSAMLFQRSQELQSALVATEAEKQRVTHVTEFLIDVFKVSDPIQNQSDIVDVKDLLDYSSQQLANQFNQEPATKAKLYQTLGSVYLNMSDIDSAERLLHQSTQFELDLPPSEQLTATLIQAELLQKKGQLKAALQLLTQYEKNHADFKLPVVADLKMSLNKGQLLYQLGALDLASETLRVASEKLLQHSNSNEKIKGEQLQADIHQLLGNVYWKKGDLKQVEIHYQRSFDSNSSRLGPQHHATLKSLSALGVLAYTQGHYELARSRFEQVLNSRIEHLGSKHFLTADAHNRLGATEYELGQLTAAEIHYNQALDGLAASGLRESIKFTRVLNNLGLIKRQQTQYQAAEQLFLQALEIQAQLLGQDNPDLAAMQNNLGLTAYDQGNFQQALEWFEQAYQVQFHANGLKNAKIAFAMTNMGRMYLKLNQPDQSRVWINQALQLRAEQLGTDHLLYAATLMAEAEWAFAVNSYEKAVKSVENALKIRESQLDQDDWRLADSRHLWHSLSEQKDMTTHQQLCADAEIIKLRFGQSHPRTQAIYHRMSEHTVTNCSHPE
ncbi:serine/threonine-protein kinase [Marinicella litoralis]|uniref:Serine/threonine protein kinase with TPR repeats n=1 Tax=Marinicella litoralis TaxID=644220 RepID=A0A4R6XUB7_9GAMM|nr:serine/threonine-protein kinase [Marinicella litoralis]TDR23595.1 serine/threonine protein kinase with TPR repeats [Marinicella litoralis]